MPPLPQFVVACAHFEVLVGRSCSQAPGGSSLSAAEASASAACLFLGLQQHASNARAAGAAVVTLACCGLSAASALGAEVGAGGVRVVMEALLVIVGCPMPDPLPATSCLSLASFWASSGEAACGWVLDAGGVEAAAAAMRAHPRHEFAYVCTYYARMHVCMHACMHACTCMQRTPTLNLKP